MPFKDYDKMLEEKNPDGRPTFRVGGQTFTARGKIPWKKFSRMILTLQQPDDDDDAFASLAKTEDFFRLVLVRADRDRFIALLNAEGSDDDDDLDDAVISPEQVSAILDDLLARYTGKDKSQDGDSSTSSDNTGVDANKPSNVVSMNPVKPSA